MMRKAKIAVVTAVFVVVGSALTAKLWADAHYYDGYEATLPLNAVVETATTDKGFRRIPFSFEGMPGERVPGILALPETGSGPFPVVIFLHGIGQSKSFVDTIARPFTDAGYALVSFDQYTRGERRIPSKNPLLQACALRRRGALTVNDTRRLIDYLDTRPDIASDRIFLVGASFGAITGAPAAAMEPRIRAVVLIYGGGDIPLLAESSAAQEEFGRLVLPMSYLGSFLLAPAEPTQYVGQISPRPVLLQNGREDSIIPVACATALQNAAREPKEIVWYEGDHIGLDEELVWRVLNDALDWIKRQDAGGALS